MGRVLVRRLLVAVASVGLLELAAVATPLAVAAVPEGVPAAELLAAESSPARVDPTVPDGDFTSSPPLDGQEAPPVDGFVAGESERVEVSATAERYRNPDGTETLVLSQGPARFEDDGEWRDIDLRLERDPEGGYVPVGSPTPVRIGSGDGVATVEVDGVELVLDIPDLIDLEQPTVDADGTLDRRPVGAEQPTDAPDAEAGGTDSTEPTAEDPAVEDDVESPQPDAPVATDADEVDGPSREVDAVGVGVATFERRDGSVVAVSPLASGLKTTHVLEAAGQVATESIRMPEGWSAQETDGVIQLLDPRGDVAVVWAGGSVFDSASVPAESFASLRLVPGADGVVTVQAVLDEAWAGDRGRVWPLVVDPTLTVPSTASSGGLDTFVQQNIINTPQSSAIELKIGTYAGAGTTRRALLYFPLSSVPSGATVLDADLDLYNSHTHTCGAYQWDVHQNTSAFSSSTVWSNQPSFAAGASGSSTQTKGGGSCPAGSVVADLTGLVQSWVSGAATNYGVTVKATDEVNAASGKYFYSAETGAPPLLYITYNRSIPASTPISPANTSVIINRTPTLVTTAVTDPDPADVEQYYFRVATGTNAESGSIVANSGWITSTSWAVPDGSLEDGGTYYWHAWTSDGTQHVSGPVVSFRVDLRLGVRSGVPYDTQGPVQVNLATGNLVVSTSSPSIPYVGGSAGVSYTYNSLAEPRSGLTGAYYDDLDDDLVIDSNESPAVVRRDPQVSASWASGAPFPGLPADNFNARWTGHLTVPTTGSYSFSGTFDDRLSIRVNGTLVYDRTAVVTTADFANATPISLTANQPVAIQVDYGEHVGNAAVVLWARQPGGAGDVIVPTSWLTPDAPALPVGWNLSADVDGSAAYTRAQLSTDQAILWDTLGTASTWRATGTNGFTPPAGQDGILTRDDQGRLTLHDGGMVYVFNAAGGLESLTSAADDRSPAALRHLWVGSPARLQRIEDPISSTGINLRYVGVDTAPGSGVDGCSTSTPPTNLYLPPPGMLCRIEYPDASVTDLWYTGGDRRTSQLARIVDPGGETTDLVYSSGRIASIRDPLAAEAVVAPSPHTRANDDTTRTLITYDGSNRVSTVTLPEPTAGAARPGATYTYGSGTSSVVAHGTPPTTTAAFGDPSDVALAGDWDGDGDTTIGVFRPSTATFYLRNTNSSGTADVSFGYGAVGDLPIVGDWDGDGDTTIGVYRPSNATFYLRNTNSAGLADTSFAWGNGAGDTPLAGDWDGDGDSTIGLYRASNTTFYLRNTNSAGGPDQTLSYGTSGDIPVVGDWDGDGDTTIGIRRSAAWHLSNGGTATHSSTTPFGSGGDTIAGDWDGPAIGGGDRPGRRSSTTFTLSGTVSSGSTRTVTYDTAARELTNTDATERTVTNTWDVADRPLTTTDPAGLQTTWVYDHAGRVTDTYGPAATSIALGSRPRTTTVYDGGTIENLAIAWFNNPTQSGAPALHDTAAPAFNYTSTQGPPIGTSGAVVDDEFSVRYTGEINLASAGVYGFGFNTYDNVRMFIDDTQVVDFWTAPPTGIVTWNLTAGVHRIRIDYRDQDNDNDANQFTFQWDLPTAGVNLVNVPAANLDPRYGLVTQVTDPDGRVTATNYAAPHLGLASNTAVDPSGLNLVTQTGYEAHATAGSFLRRTSRTLPAGNQTTYAYHGTGANPATVTNPCPAGTSAHQAGRLYSTTSPTPASGSAITEYVIYDNMGRPVATHIGSDGDTCTTYDTRGRVASVTYPAYGGEPGRTVTYSHAVGGNPLATSVQDSSLPAGPPALDTVTTTVDLLGRVIAYKDVWGTTTTYTYDQQGRRTGSTGPAGTLAWTYDDAGRPESVRLDSQLVADPNYDTAGRLSTVSYPAGAGNGGNGTSLAPIGYDDLGRVNDLHWLTPTTATITRDQIDSRSAGGDILDQRTDGGADPNGATDNYVYDGAGRLTSAVVTASLSITWEFAPTGGCGANTAAGKNTNRTSQTTNGGTPITYCYDNSDRLTSTSQSGIDTIAYDSHGNTTTIAGETHGYDITNRHQVTTAGATSVRYTRDPFDRITARSVNGSEVARYGHSLTGDTPSYTMSANSTTVIERTLVLPGGVLLTKRTGGDVWNYPNIHGDLVATANSSGAEAPGATTVVYDPYGNLVAGSLPDNSADNLDYGWLGQSQRPLEHEGSLLQIVEMGARQYSPLLGRFLEVDPIEGGSSNSYEYAAGNPISNIDLDGRSLCKKGWGRMVCTSSIRPMRKSTRRSGLGSVLSRVEIGFSGCAIRCFGVGTQGGTVYRQTGWGCCFVGPSIGFATREYSRRACNAVGVSGNIGPVGASADMGIYNNGRTGPYSPSADISVSYAPGYGGGVYAMTNVDILGTRYC